MISRFLHHSRRGLADICTATVKNLCRQLWRVWSEMAFGLDRGIPTIETPPQKKEKKKKKRDYGDNIVH